MFEGICGSAIVIGIGLLSIFARDFMWELTHWSNRTKGIASERTETWDAWSVISGIILVGVGVVVLLLLVGADMQERQRIEAATATASSRLSSLEATYAPIIPTLRAEAGFEAQERNGRTVGLPGDETLVYGLCRDEDFFLYVLSGFAFRGEAYLQDNTPESCEPGGWNVYSVNRLGESALGGDWYSFSVVRMPTRTPRATPTATPAP